MKPVDIVVVVTFHAEGLIAHRSLNSIFRSCRQAETLGITTTLIAAVDDADARTQNVVRFHPGLRSCDRVIDLSFGDVSLSRNFAVQESESTYIAIVDGDDLVSSNWFAAALYRARMVKAPSVIHPQVVVTFGLISQFCAQPDQSQVELDEMGLLVVNPWNVCAFGKREVFVSIPYTSTGSRNGGFGYEDWHWNCETLAAGYNHLIAPHTAYFERRKPSGSLNRLHRSTGAVIRSSTLFRKSR